MRLLRAVDFFLPLDVLSAVLMVFALENVVEHTIGEASVEVWIVLYFTGAVIVAAANYYSADEEEIEEAFEEE